MLRDRYLSCRIIIVIGTFVGSFRKERKDSVGNEKLTTFSFLGLLEPCSSSRLLCSALPDRTCCRIDNLILFCGQLKHLVPFFFKQANSKFILTYAFESSCGSQRKVKGMKIFLAIQQKCLKKLNEAPRFKIILYLLIKKHCMRFSLNISAVRVNTFTFYPTQKRVVQIFLNAAKIK